MLKPVCPTEIRTGFLPSASRTLILVGLSNVGNLRVTQKIGVVRATVTLATTYRTAGCGIGEDRLKVIRFGGEFGVDNVASRTNLHAVCCNKAEATLSNFEVLVVRASAALVLPYFDNIQMSVKTSAHLY